jgi:hypothetical protein
MLKVNIASAEGFSNDQLEKVYNAKDLIESVLNSDTFKGAILNFTFKGKKTFFYRKNILGRWLDDPYSNEEVYQIIMQSYEKHGDVNQNQMDLYLNLLPTINKDVIGYGYPGSKEIYTYRNWFDNFTLAEYCGHITHEWVHKLGFSHAHHHNWKRKFSVPYAIGDIIEELAEQS